MARIALLCFLLTGCALTRGIQDEISRQARTPGSDLSTIVGSEVPGAEVLLPAAGALLNADGLPEGASTTDKLLYVLGTVIATAGAGYLAHRKLGKGRAA